MAKKRAPKFNAEAAFAASPDDDSMGQDSQQPSDPSQQGPPDPTGGAASGQPLSIPPDVVGQMEQLKQTGDFQSLGQLVAQLLP